MEYNKFNFKEGKIFQISFEKNLHIFIFFNFKLSKRYGFVLGKKKKQAFNPLIFQNRLNDGFYLI